MGLLNLFWKIESMVYLGLILFFVLPMTLKGMVESHLAFRNTPDSRKNYVEHLFWLGVSVYVLYIGFRMAPTVLSNIFL